MKPFLVNRYGRIVFPDSYFPALDFSVFESLEQFAAAIRRDFEDKAPNEADIAARLETGAYKGRYELLRDLALDLFWVNRYALTMYDKNDINGTELRAFAGNFLFSTGANQHADRFTLGHFDLPMRNCTITLDNQTVVDEGYECEGGGLMWASLPTPSGSQATVTEGWNDESPVCLTVGTRQRCPYDGSRWFDVQPRP